MVTARILRFSPRTISLTFPLTGETYLISSVEIFHALMSVAFYVSIMAQRLVRRSVALASEKTRSEWRRRAEIHRTILTSGILNVLACRKVFPTIGRQGTLGVVMRQPKADFVYRKLTPKRRIKNKPVRLNRKG